MLAMATIKEDANVGDMAKQEYPRDETRPMDILHLPMDILYSIFDHFHDDTNIPFRIHRKDIEINTIQNARLVCSLFNRLASPLLCPVLTVQLDQTSLDLVDEISRNPLIASGVRGIDVVLHYRPKELAEDLLRFKSQREKDLYKLRDFCHYKAETWWLGGHDKDDETVCKQPLKVYEKAMGDYRAIIAAWVDCFGPPPDEIAIDADTLRYQEILQQGHEEYRQKHEEQLRLITDGTFVDTLASAIFRMGHCTFLHFEDEIGFRSYLDPYSYEPTLVSTNPEELPRLMATPVDWRTIEELQGGADLAPAKLLSELPIAIHKAGATMSVIEAYCFPTTNNYAMIRPDRLDPNNPAWADLRAASQHLLKFELHGSHTPLRYRHLLAEEQAPIDEYLCAMLSGQRIEDVNLNFHTFSLHDGGRSSDLEGSYRIGAVLATANWPRIKRLWIRYVSLHQNELEAFCRGLGGGRMDSLNLNGVELLSGSWAGALDLLRERVASRCRDGKCNVKFGELTGGEFGRKKKKKKKDWGSFMESEEEEEEDEEEPLIVVLAQKYVSGVGMENPLRG
jgi:hypothetical protein